MERGERHEREPSAEDAGGSDLHEPASSAGPAVDGHAPAPATPPIPAASAMRQSDAMTATRRARLALWWGAASPNLRGSIYMVTAFCFFSVMLTLIKMLGSQLPLTQILVVRQVVVMIIIMLAINTDLPAAIRTKRPFLQLIRGSCSLGAMTGGFLAIIHLPMAEATALGFSQVFFVTLAAIALLGEKVDGKRWIAMLIGFVGVLVILRPTGAGMNYYAYAAIIGAVFGAGITVTVRLLGETERTETIMLWQGTILIVTLSVPAWLAWVPPTREQWILLATLGTFGTAGQWLITRAYQVGEASALAPLDFIRLLLATASGFLVFGEIPDLVTALGASLVVIGTLYTVRRNSRRAIAPAAPPDEAPLPATLPETEKPGT